MFKKIFTTIIVIVLGITGFNMLTGGNNRLQTAAAANPHTVGKTAVSVSDKLVSWGKSAGEWIDNKVSGSSDNGETSTVESSDSSVFDYAIVGEADGSDYDRTAMFGDWAKVNTDCNANEEVRLRDFSNVVSEGCKVISGDFVDPYTNENTTFVRGEGGVDIDHIVPAKYASQHGASSWTQDQRVAFYNDLNNLVNTNAKSNRSKSDSGPAEWLPEANQCEYSTNFVKIINSYNLTISQKDLDAAKASCGL